MAGIPAHAYLGLVHHANQYLITDGYDNREGLASVIGSAGSGSGLAHVLDLHAKYGIPINLHISGTLLEAVAWHVPGFLEQVRSLIEAGLVELVGSCYGQNIMRFFGPDYNRKQLNEELRLYQWHLGVDPRRVCIFWPPERVWETSLMAPLLRDARLLNNGYAYVILDDRLLLPSGSGALPRNVYDSREVWSPDLFQMHTIDEGLGLLALPIATRLRRSIPPGRDGDWEQVRKQLEALLVHYADEGGSNLLAVYADDMEKVAGVGEWGREGPERYERFLAWVAGNRWIRSVKLSEWAARNEPASTRKIETGTFEELAKQFDAGEGYERWYFAPDWTPYRGYFDWAESRVGVLASEGADASLIALAEKQLLVGNWETAWHTPPQGPHGDPNANGHASPWARALTSHSRHAAVTAEAAHWMVHKGGSAHAEMVDVDGDGEQEVVIKNGSIYAVITARWGARVVSLYRVAGERGMMMAGNPCDDWNWMEELNKFMEVPRNHPGCFADVGFENDAYQVVRCDAEDGIASVLLRNVQTTSAARGLTKRFTLAAAEPYLTCSYEVPGLRSVDVEFALSPDYLTLLRGGSRCIREVRSGFIRGFANAAAVAYVEPIGKALAWTEPLQPRVGHGCMLRLTATAPKFEIALGTADAGTGNLSELQEQFAEPVR